MQIWLSIGVHCVVVLQFCFGKTNGVIFVCSRYFDGKTNWLTDKQTDRQTADDNGAEFPSWLSCRSGWKGGTDRLWNRKRRIWRNWNHSQSKRSCQSVSGSLNPNTENDVNLFSCTLCSLLIFTYRNLSFCFVDSHFNDSRIEMKGCVEEEGYNSFFQHPGITRRFSFNACNGAGWRLAKHRPERLCCISFREVHRVPHFGLCTFTLHRLCCGAVAQRCNSTSYLSSLLAVGVFLVLFSLRDVLCRSGWRVSS